MDDEKRASALKEVSTGGSAPRRREKKPKGTRKKSILGIALVVLLISAAVLLVALQQKRGIPFISDAQDIEESISFEPHTSNVYAAFKGGLVVASVADATLYGTDGSTIYQNQFTAESPALACGENAVAAYDIGGTSLLVFNENKTLFTYESAQQLIDVSVNQKNWVTVCELEDNYKGSATVLDEGGKSVYKWYSAQGYVLCASLSPNSKYMAVVTLEQKQEVFRSKVTVFALDSEDVYAEYTLEDDVILKAIFSENNRIACIAENSLIILDGGAQARAVYDYGGYDLHNYSLGPDYVVLSLSRTNAGLYGRVVTVDLDGRELGSADLAGTVECLSASGNRVAVLIDNSLKLYTSRMKDDGGLSSADGAKKVLLRDDGSALILTYTDAKLYIP